MENSESSSLAPNIDTNIDTYLELMADVVGLKIPPEIRPTVVDNFERIRAIAQPLLDFELPDDIEPGPTFKP